MKTVRNILVVASIALQIFQFSGDDSYNCHNYAWETERRWLNDPTPCIVLATECTPEQATRIVYFEASKPIHSGVYIGCGWVKSKWGSNPVVIHPWWATTYGWNVEYYR